MSLGFSRLQTNWKLHLDTTKVLRAMGTDPRRPGRSQQFASFTEKVVADYASCLEPRAAMAEFVVRRESPHLLSLENGIELHNPTVRQRLAGSGSIVAVVGTIGERLGQGVEQDDLALNLVLDGLGTAAITALTDAVLGEIRVAARTAGLNVTSPLYPGMKGWELAEGQTEIFALVNGSTVGVSLNESFMMKPHKSVSFLVGVGARVTQDSNGCEDCEAAAHCHHKTRHYES